MMMDGALGQSRAGAEVGKLLCRLIALYFAYVALLATTGWGEVMVNASHYSEMDQRLHARALSWGFTPETRADELQGEHNGRMVRAGLAIGGMWATAALLWLGAGWVGRRTAVGRAGDTLDAPAVLATATAVFGLGVAGYGLMEVLAAITLYGDFHPAAWLASQGLRPFISTVERGIVGSGVMTVVGVVIALTARRISARLMRAEEE